MSLHLSRYTKEKAKAKLIRGISLTLLTAGPKSLWLPMLSILDAELKTLEIKMLIERKLANSKTKPKRKLVLKGIVFPCQISIIVEALQVINVN